MIRVKVKKGSRVRGMSPVLVIALLVAKAVYEELEAPELVITECTGGDHRSNSLHHTGEAIDIRIWTLLEHRREEAHRLIAHRLGAEWDVILHDTHLHIEYDPA